MKRYLRRNGIALAVALEIACVFATPAFAQGAPDGASAPAEQPLPPPDATAPAATPNDDVTVEAPNVDRVRCRRAEPGVGSIIGRRICSSIRQDRERTERDQQQLQQMQDRQIGVCVPSTRPGSCGGSGG